MKKILRGDLLIIFIVTGLGMMAMAIQVPILPLYLTSIGIVPVLIGLMQAASMAGMALGDTSGGWLADKIGLKTPLLIGTLLCAPVVLCFVFTRGVLPLFLIFIVWGIFRATIFGPARGYIGNTSALENKATLMAIYMLVMTVSRSLASLASGFVADNLDYDWNFYLAVGLYILAGLLILGGMQKIPLRKLVPPKDPGALVSPARVSRPGVNYRQLGFQYGIVVLFFMALGINTFLPLLATEFAGVTATRVGILNFIGGGVGAILFIPSGRLADRSDKKPLIIVGLLLSAAGLAGLAFARDFTFMVLMYIVWNIGFALFTPASAALLSNTVPVYWQGTAMGIYGTSEDIGIILGSSVGGFLWTAGGPVALYLTGGAAGVLGALICLGFVKSTPAGPLSARP